MCDAGGANIRSRLNNPGDIMRGGFAFRSRVGRQNHFLNFTFIQSRRQFVQPDVDRADAIQRRQVPHEHEEQAFIISGL